MYIISVFHKEEVLKLQDEWLFLEKGTEMTYFQSFHWNQMLTEFTPCDNEFCEAIYCLVRDREGRAILIAPLWIIKSTFRVLNKKGVYLIGRQGWSDYLNLIYRDFDPQAVSFLFQWIKNTFHLRLFFFEQLKETNSLYRYIVNTCKVNKNITTKCVHLPLLASVEEYHKTLSKNSRQNLRTAYNRLQKDRHSITFDFDDKPDLELCKQMRACRLAKRNDKNYSILDKFKKYIKDKFVFKFPSYLPFYEDKQSHFLTAYIDGELCAFFCYGLDNKHEEIVLMAVGISEKYAKYSPGVLLLYEYIKHQIVERDIKTIDMTRGDEKYKYVLGGINHFIQTINFEL
jgi:hypothetical protein